LVIQGYGPTIGVQRDHAIAQEQNMARKIAKLILSYPHHPLDAKDKNYKVVRSQHTTEYNPGDFLTKAEVDQLNDSAQWDVSVTAAEK
jgi:hypothetical protein